MYIWSVLDDYNNNNCFLLKTEESNSLVEYRATVEADLLFIYIFCFFNCVVHFVSTDGLTKSESFGKT